MKLATGGPRGSSAPGRITAAAEPKDGVAPVQPHFALEVEDAEGPEVCDSSEQLLRAETMFPGINERGTGLTSGRSQVPGALAGKVCIQYGTVCFGVGAADDEMIKGTTCTSFATYAVDATYNAGALGIANAESFCPARDLPSSAEVCISASANWLWAGTFLGINEAGTVSTVESEEHSQVPGVWFLSIKEVGTVSTVESDEHSQLPGALPGTVCIIDVDDIIDVDAAGDEGIEGTIFATYSVDALGTAILRFGNCC